MNSKFQSTSSCLCIHEMFVSKAISEEIKTNNNWCHFLPGVKLGRHPQGEAFFGAKQIWSKWCETPRRHWVYRAASVGTFINSACCVGQSFLICTWTGLTEGIRRTCSWALKLQVVRINSIWSRTAPLQHLQAHAVCTGGIALKQKAIYLLNTPSGLFIAVVHGTHPLESQCPPGCLLRSGKSKWLFHWMRYVKPLGQIAGTNRACCFPTFSWESGGVVYHKRHISFKKGSSCCWGRLSHRRLYM